MASYKKKEMNRKEYLVQMGAVSLKSLREISKRGIAAPKDKAPVRRPETLPSAPSSAPSFEDSFSESHVSTDLRSRL